MGKKYGYIRISSIDQNESRQRIALCEQEITEEALYIDKISGKDFQRPQYQAMLKRLKPGDQLCLKISTVDVLYKITTGICAFHIFWFRIFCSFWFDGLSKKRTKFIIYHISRKRRQDI